jgi:hypothetical protein
MQAERAPASQKGASSPCVIAAVSECRPCAISRTSRWNGSLRSRRSVDFSADEERTEAESEGE